MWLLFTDLHLDLYKAFATIDANGLNSRLLKQIEVVQQVKRLARRNNVSTIFFLGDLFNSLSATVPKIIYNVAFYLVQSLADVADVYLLTGNHDIFQKIHMFTPFTSIPRVKVINDSTSIMLNNRSIDLIPWGGDLFGEDKSNYCFGHFGIVGATVGSGSFVEADQVPIDAFEGYKLVLAGHYHTRQMLGPNIYHIGDVMSISFKDTTEDKGIWLLDPVTDGLEFIPIKSPKFYTVEAAFSNEIDEFTKKDRSKDYWRLIVKSDNLMVPELEPNVLVEYDFDPRSTDETPVDTTEITNLIPIIQEYIDKSNTQLDKTVLKEKAIEILEV